MKKQDFLKKIKKMSPIEYILSVAVIISGVAIDQVTKALAFHFLGPVTPKIGGKSVPIIEGVLHFTGHLNDGCIGGLFSDKRYIFLIISTVMIVGIGIYLFGFCKERMMLKVGLALIVSGGIGNMIDRIAYGYVVDMIDFYLFDWWHWIFNIADAFVCIGAGVVVLALVLDLIKDMKEKKQKNEDKQ